MKCIYCSGVNLHKYGVRNKKQKYHCLDCQKFFTRTSKKYNGNTIIEGKKFCTKCGKFKELSKFNLKYGKPRSNCKECDKKHTSRFSRYDLNKNDFQEMILNQNNKCAICGKNFKNNRYTYIDHNHINGNVRGLLCPKCNALLGNCNDNIKILEFAIQYLNKYKNADVMEW
ncbi:MAG TPA: endonuclease VII domain-containing protein [Salinivirgaceae bacterium]|nr:endonuclease VII domain-containing protein [Salinivirgaceae bacterium]